VETAKITKTLLHISVIMSAKKMTMTKMTKRDPGPYAAWLRYLGFKYERRIKPPQWVCKNGSAKAGTR